MTWTADIFLSYLPAFIANATPVVLISIPLVRKWNRPIALSLLGSHKTWAGLIGGIFFGAVAGALLSAFLPSSALPTVSALYSSLLSASILGAILGFGALAGDSAKSFIKRRIGFPPGARLPVFDNIDYILGALLFGLPFHVPSLPEILLLLLLGLVLSILTNLLSYAVGLKSVWY